MNVSRFAADNSRAIVLGVVLMTLAGLYSMTVLPSGIYPEVEFPRIVVIAQAGNLSPRIMLRGASGSMLPLEGPAHERAPKLGVPLED